MSRASKKRHRDALWGAIARGLTGGLGNYLQVSDRKKTRELQRQAQRSRDEYYNERQKLERDRLSEATRHNREMEMMDRLQLQERMTRPRTGMGDYERIASKYASNPEALTAATDVLDEVGGLDNIQDAEKLLTQRIADYMKKNPEAAVGEGFGVQSRDLQGMKNALGMLRFVRQSRGEFQSGEAPAADEAGGAGDPGGGFFNLVPGLNQMMQGAQGPPQAMTPQAAAPPLTPTPGMATAPPKRVADFLRTGEATPEFYQWAREQFEGVKPSITYDKMLGQRVTETENEQLQRAVSEQGQTIQQLQGTLQSVIDQLAGGQPGMPGAMPQMGTTLQELSAPDRSQMTLEELLNSGSAAVPRDPRIKMKR